MREHARRVHAHDLWSCPRRRRIGKAWLVPTSGKLGAVDMLDVVPDIGVSLWSASLPLTRAANMPAQSGCTTQECIDGTGGGTSASTSAAGSTSVIGTTGGSGTIGTTGGNSSINGTGGNGAGTTGGNSAVITTGGYPGTGGGSSCPAQITDAATCNERITCQAYNCTGTDGTDCFSKNDCNTCEYFPNATRPTACPTGCKFLIPGGCLSPNQ